MYTNIMVDRNLSNTKTGLLIWKASNLWQQILRQSLKKYELTLNEFLILEALLNVKDDSVDITQIYISRVSGIDVSVVSTVLKLLEKKILIKKKADLDDRKKIIELTSNANSLLSTIVPIMNSIENNLFKKLDKEEPNFCNSLRLILGRKIRVKAVKY